MQPDEKLIEKFRQVYIEEYGEEMSPEEAYDNFVSLLDLLRVISRRTELSKRGQEDLPHV